MTQPAGAVIVMESQWRDLNLSSFVNIVLWRLVLSLAAVMCTHICANGDTEKPPARGAGLSAFLVCDCDC